MDQLDGDYLEKFLEAMTKDNKEAGANMRSYLGKIEARGEAKGRAEGKAEGKILGAVGMLLTMNVSSSDIKNKICQSYPDFDQSKLDDIIKGQKKELGIS